MYRKRLLQLLQLRERLLEHWLKSNGKNRGDILIDLMELEVEISDLQHKKEGKNK